MRLTWCTPQGRSSGDLSWTGQQTWFSGANSNSYFQQDTKWIEFYIQPSQWNIVQLEHNNLFKDLSAVTKCLLLVAGHILKLAFDVLVMDILSILN